MQHRQGDLLLEKVNKLPKGVIKKKDNVFALGEVTGHKHQLKVADGKVFTYVDEEGNVWSEIPEPTLLVHEEHKPVRLEPGVWKVTRQREYSPRQNRMVLD